MSHFKDWKIKKKGKYFYRGEWDEKIFNKSIAVVGSRRMTRYGSETIDKFVCDFVANGVITISGFMYGIDTEVAKKTVEYGGKHVAIFGCGLDYVYPPENEKLYGEILESRGLVISQYEPNAKPHLWKFPQRNKLVAGFSSLGVLVIEGGLKSGSLVTAEIARKMKKPLFAIPGPINSSVSAGCNDLIKKGWAKMATTPSDVLGSKIQISQNSKNQSKPKLSKIENEIYKALELEPLNIDEIAAQTEESIVEVGKEVSIMSIKGLLTESGGKYYLSNSLK